MAQLVKVKQFIAQIADRRKNVRLEDIVWVVDQLEALDYAVTRKQNEHGMFFSVAGRRFSVCTHHRGQSQLKTAYVDAFLAEMSELELYDG